MAAESEDWSDGEMASGDGLEHMLCGSPALESAPTTRVAESSPSYAGKSTFKRQTTQAPTADTPARGKQSTRSNP